MNSLKIITDKEGNVLKCRYYEKIDDDKYYLVSHDKVDDLLDILANKYANEIKRKKNNDDTFLFSINNIDEKLIQAFISNNKFKSSKKKVKRINKFKKIVLITSVGISVFASAFLISCASSKKTDPTLQSTTIEYTTDYLAPTSPETDRIIDTQETQYSQKIETSQEESSLIPTTSKMPDEIITSSSVSLQTNSETQTQESLNTDSKNKYKPITLSIQTGDDTKSDKYINCKKNYFDLIVEYSNIYGVDPYLMLAIACQEKGFHSNILDDKGAIGLFQIQMTGEYTWDGKDIYAYNFRTNSFETYHITFDEASKIEPNIKIACMYFQECLIANNYNIPKAITAYNAGCDGLEEALKNAISSTGYDSSYFDDQTHLEWLNYRDYTNKDIDSLYLEHVLNWMENETTMRFITPKGDIIESTFINQESNIGLKK